MKLKKLPFDVIKWETDELVKMLTREEKSIWFDMICMMWKSKDQGYLVLNGKPMEFADIEASLGLLNQTESKTLAKFDRIGLFKRREDGAIYSPGLLKEIDISEKRSISGKKGGNPALIGNLLNQIPSKPEANIQPKPKQKGKQKASKEPSKNLQDEKNGVFAYIYNNTSTVFNNNKIIQYLSDERVKAESSKLPDLETLWTKYVEFMKWINDKAEMVNRMDKPFTFEQFMSLQGQTEITKEQVSVTLKAMHNYRPLIKNNKEAYLTMLNWIRRDMDKNKPNNNTPSFTSQS